MRLLSGMPHNTALIAFVQTPLLRRTARWHILGRVDAQMIRSGLNAPTGKLAAILPGERPCGAGMVQSDRIVQRASSAHAPVQLMRGKSLALIRRAAISVPYWCALK
jgi:hypothetical protein